MPCLRSAVSGKYECEQTCENSGVQRFRETDGHGTIRMIEEIEDIARESMNDLVENASEKKYRFRLDYMDEELTVDEFIRGRMKKVVDSNIETMVESKAKSFVNELRKRYDMAFAAFVVDNMRKQNMLKEDKIAELLKDNPNEK